MIRAYENPLVSLDKPGFIKPLFRFWVYVAVGVYFDPGIYAAVRGVITTLVLFFGAQPVG